MAQKVFLVEELCHEICWSIDLRERSGTLAQLARCSRSLAGPALDVLWYEMDSMRPLMELIPVVQSKIDPEDGAVTYYLGGPIEDQHWIRFDIYAHRIRVLRYHHGGATDGDCRIYSRLALSRPLPMFPNLRSLTWLHDELDLLFDHQFIEEISPFLMTSLQTLSLGTYWWEALDFDQPDKYEVAECFVSTLARRCPSLEHFALRGRIQDMSLAFIGTFHHLRSLDLSLLLMDQGYVDAELLNALGTLPELQSISGLQAIKPIRGHISPTSSFPALKSLGFSHIPVTSLLLIVKAITSMSFRSLDVRHLHNDSPADLDALLSTLTIFPKFEEICLCNFTPWLSDLKMPCIESFFRLGLLRKVELRLWSAVNDPRVMEPDLVDRMASAWPKLESLSTQYAFPISSLWSLALRCPKLTRLAFEKLVFRDDDPTQIVQDTPILSHPLRELAFDLVSTTDDYAWIAAVLDRLFPHLLVSASKGSPPGITIALLKLRSQSTKEEVGVLLKTSRILG
ncbi:hypothetical protein JAAARDRAFT_205226 [Jaapia argillacea MUCL 33604]|uniref:F-box domain-containing protein n=1 Tax=Jaapia argillacea MUCL 33604 TaxID=933084 RepID=A0A067PZI7_9AGAM|nr:hypothetical protein JAAARDRAFT_205226 [Jaapia argillacea MUCL 33604]